MKKARDEKGRFISTSAQALLMQSKELEKKAQELIEAENNPPSWLKEMIIAFAQIIGITPEEFAEQIKVVHPASFDPVLIIQGKPIISWI